MTVAGCGTTPTIHTERLTLRPLLPADTDALWETVGRADVMAHYVDLADHTTGWTRDQTAEFIDANTRVWAERGWGYWGLGLSGRLIGYCGLGILDYLPLPPPAVEIECRVHPDHWGGGLAGEASAAALHYGLTVAGLREIFAAVVAGNTQSHRAVTKIGWPRVGTYPYTSPVSGRSDTFTVYRATPETGDHVSHARDGYSLRP